MSWDVGAREQSPGAADLLTAGWSLVRRGAQQPLSQGQRAQ